MECFTHSHGNQVTTGTVIPALHFPTQASRLATSSSSSIALTLVRWYLHPERPDLHKPCVVPLTGLKQGKENKMLMKNWFESWCKTSHCVTGYKTTKHTNQSKIINSQRDRRPSPQAPQSLRVCTVYSWQPGSISLSQPKSTCLRKHLILRNSERVVEINTFPQIRALYNTGIMNCSEQLDISTCIRYSLCL